MPKLTPSAEIIGKTFSFLTIIEDLGRIQKGKIIQRIVLAQCVCGKTIEVSFNNVRRSLTKSCGCYSSKKKSERRKTHGLSNSRLYRIYRHMINRCNNPKSKYYGAKGITYCKEWNTFEGFYDWAINNGYNDNLTIDRFPDRHGNYGPDNCRWATMLQQQRNRDFTLLINFNGEDVPLADLSIQFGINYGTLKSRIFRSGWSVEKAIETPLLFKYKKS